MPTRRLSGRLSLWGRDPTPAKSTPCFRVVEGEQLHGQRFVTRRQAKDEVIAWLLRCKQTRLHSTLTYVSPIRFEQD